MFATIRFVTHEQMVNYQRRQARLAINTIFEEVFDFGKRRNTYVVSGVEIGIPNLNADTTYSNFPLVTIDDRYGKDGEVEANMTINIKRDAIDINRSGHESKVDRCIVTIKLEWDGGRESVELTRLLTQL